MLHHINILKLPLVDSLLASGEGLLGFSLLKLACLVDNIYGTPIIIPIITKIIPYNVYVSKVENGEMN